MSVSLLSSAVEGNCVISAPTHISQRLLRAARFCPDARIFSVDAGTQRRSSPSYSSVLEQARAAYSRWSGRLRLPARFRRRTSARMSSCRLLGLHVAVTFPVHWCRSR